MTPAQQIEAAKNVLVQLQQSVSRIINCDPSSFYDGEIGNCVERLKKACDQSVLHLEKPSLRISTIGTTSSGKSTLVNAIIGRRLAPMEADEMSAGILTFVHGEKSRMIVEKTENAVWETGEWAGLNDDQLYLKLRATKQEHGYDGVMVAYHKEKKKRNNLDAPRVRIEAPILPVLFRELLNLPDGIQFELSDLPGLKWDKDRQNLKVIQEKTKNTFSLVVLDYLQTDENGRASLLKELKEVVEAMYGSTDAMIFLLNKINARSEDDQKLEYRYAKLREEIAQQLKLSSAPDLLGIDARLLYYVQCAWGPDKKPLTPGQRRTQLLENCMDDCSKTFRQKRKEDKEVKEWLHKYEDTLDNLSDEGFKKLFQWAHIWSGGKEFWDTLRQRIDERFPELVISPALLETLNAFKEFAGKTEELIRIRKIETKELVEQERNRINEEMSAVLNQVEFRKQMFHAQIRSIIGDLKKNDPEATNRAIDSLTKNFPGLGDLKNVIEDVRNDLFFNIIIPVRDAFKQGNSVYDLESVLNNSLSATNARHVAQTYDYYSREFLRPDSANNGLKFEIKKDDITGIERLEHAEQRCINLYQRMRESLSARAEFVLQKKSQKIEEIIVTVLLDESRHITEIIKNNLSSYKGAKNSLPDFALLIQTTAIQLPDNLFTLPIPQKTAASKREKIGTEQKSSTHETGSCFKDIHTEWETIDKYGNVPYHVLELPGADGMAEQWENGISIARDSLWEKLAEWISNAFEGALAQYSQALIQSQIFFEEECNKQIRILEEQGTAEMERWDTISELMKNTNSVHDELKSLTITTKGQGESYA